MRGAEGIVLDVSIVTVHLILISIIPTRHKAQLMRWAELVCEIAMQFALLVFCGRSSLEQRDGRRRGGSGSGSDTSNPDGDDR